MPVFHNRGKCFPTYQETLGKCVGLTVNSEGRSINLEESSWGAGWGWGCILLRKFIVKKKSSNDLKLLCNT